MRPRPSLLALLCASRTVEGGVFDREALVRRAGPQNDTCKTVTETIRQTITINGAEAQAVNQSATKTVTVSVHDGSTTPSGDNGMSQDEQLHDEALKGFRIRFVTQTVAVTQAQKTKTVLAKASTVFATMPAQTIVKTVTAPCANTPANTPGTPPAVLPSAAPPVVIKPGPNADGNGIGVTTLPIPAAELPKTTLKFDPLAGSAAPPAPPAPPTATPIAPAPSPPSAPSAQPPSVDQPVAPQPQPTAPPPPAGTDTREEDAPSTAQAIASSNDVEAPAASAPAASAPAESLVQGTSTVQSPATSAANVFDPKLPSIDLSSFSLDSEINLGNLIPRTDGAAPQATGGV